MKTITSVAVLIALLVSLTPISAQDSTTLKLWRFFNECADQFRGVTEIGDDTDVCAINQIFANKWNAENSEIQVETTVVSWPGIVELNSAIATGNAPDIMTLHAFRIPLYASRGVLTPLTPYLEEAGIEVDDLLPNVRDAVSYNGEIYALPMDIHGMLWAINLDMWGEAGLLDADGNPMIPVGRDEFMAACEAMLETHNAPLLDVGTDDILGTSFAWFSFHQQFGGTIVNEDGLPNINSEAGIEALQLLIDLIDAGCATRGEIGVIYESFINGNIGGVVAGTWQVNEFDKQIREGSNLQNMYVAPFPTIGPEPGIWGGSHVWIVPQGPNPDPQRILKSLAYLKFVYDNNLAWTHTGHSTVRQSVLESDDYRNLPHRAEYEQFAHDAEHFPGALWMTAFDSIMHEELQAAILGLKTPEQALADAQFRLDDFAAFQN